MSIFIKPAPLPMNEEVVARQNGLKLSTTGAGLQKVALETLVERNAIKLSPHPEVALDDPVDWFMDPFGQRNWCAQLQMLRWLRPLVADAKMNGNTSSAELLGQYIRSWGESAFPVEDSPKFCWLNMMDAVRSLELLRAYPVAQVEDQELIRDILFFHGQWIAEPKNLGHSNHAVWQHMALFVLGHVFAESQWISTSKERIKGAFEKEYDEQGINREAAPGYHLYNYVLWNDVRERMDAEGDSIAGLSEKLELARKALIQFTWPDGNLIELGDTAPSTHLKKLAGKDDINYVLSKGADGEIPEQTFSNYSAGYAFGRSGWGANARDYRDEFFWALRYGEVGVHGHNDLGSFYLGASGQKLLIDAGKYGYMADENSTHISGRTAHNTLVVEDSSLKADAKYELLNVHHSTSVDDIEVRGFPYQGIRHTRRVIYIRGADAVLILDEATSRTAHEYHLNWHLNPDAAIHSQLGTHHIEIDSTKFSITQLGSQPRTEVLSGVSEPKMEGWYSPAWGELMPTPTLKMTKSGERLNFVTAIALDEKRRFKAEAVSQNGKNFVLTTAHGYFNVDVSVSPATVTFTREDKLFDAKSQQSVESAISMAVSEIDSRSECFETSLGKQILQRIEVYTSEHPSAAQSIRKGIELSRRLGPNDFGIRAAVIDALSFCLGEEHPIIGALQSIEPNYRDPLSFKAIDDSNADSHIFQSSPDVNKRFTGFAVEGRHVLPWAGKQGNKTLLVRFNGAVDRARVALPYFGGVTSLYRRDESCLVFSDPAFDMNRDLNLGWYLGELPDGTLIYDWINTVIDEYVKAWGIEQVVLLGASGGGYASLQVGLRRKNAKILTMNPQTILSNYFKGFYLRGRDSAFSDGASFEARCPEAFDARYLLSTNEADAIIHYVDNAKGDKHHHEKHFLPFLEAAQNNHQSMKHIVVDTGSGHKAIGPDHVNELLDALIDL